MEEVISGIVISAVSYGDNDKILNVFTLEKGVVSARIKGVKKAGAKLKFAAEPFCFAEYVFLKSGDKRTVIGASLIDSFYPIREDIKKLYSAAAAAEFIKAFSREEIVSPELFITFCECLKGLAYGESGFTNALVKFYVQSLALVGYGLSLRGCANCGVDIAGRTFFDYNKGGFTCEECFDGNGREIINATYRALKKADENLDISEEEGFYALRLIDFYLFSKTETRLKSLKTLIELA